MLDEDSEENPLEPASDDEIVQAYLDAQLRESIAGARSSMECIRRVWPELTHELPETAQRTLEMALGELERAVRSLHRAGPYIMGRDRYRDFMAAQTERQIRS